jgi:hypothetical protein
MHITADQALQSCAKDPLVDVYHELGRDEHIVHDLRLLNNDLWDWIRVIVV